jgi:hypothetical protein
MKNILDKLIDILSKEERYVSDGHLLKNVIVEAALSLDPIFLKLLLNNEEITAGSFKFGLALAIYMGFSDIILVGCDYTHKKSRSHHWFERGKGIFKSTEGYCYNYFNIAQKYAKITTITINGETNFLPSMTYKDFTVYFMLCQVFDWKKFHRDLEEPNQNTS